MNKEELVKAVGEKNGFTKKETGEMMEAIFEEISVSLADGDKVSIHGFGTFEVKNRAARTGRNPRTSEPIEIPASVGIKFKPSKILKDACKG